jgi:addiction module HigA family antidote
MATLLDPVTPGEILRDEFLADYGLSQNKLALALQVPVSMINRIVNNKMRISAEMALRLARYFGTDAQSWMNMQTSYDLRMAEREAAARIEKEVRPLQA